MGEDIISAFCGNDLGASYPVCIGLDQFMIGNPDESMLLLLPGMVKSVLQKSPALGKVRIKLSVISTEICM